MNMIQAVIVLDLLKQTYKLEFTANGGVLVSRFAPHIHPKFWDCVEGMEKAWVIDAYDNNTCDPHRMYQPYPIAR
jgi:hypothetical protein